MNTAINPAFLHQAAPVIVQKEQILQFHFPNQEVLRDTPAIFNRLKLLQLATTLGNIDHQKISILFQDEEALKMVSTTIWSTCDTHITLKGGAMIPINRIYSINFYNE